MKYLLLFSFFLLNSSVSFSQHVKVTYKAGKYDSLTNVDLKTFQIDSIRFKIIESKDDKRTLRLYPYGNKFVVVNSSGKILNYDVVSYSYVVGNDLGEAPTNIFVFRNSLKKTKKGSRLIFEAIKTVDPAGKFNKNSVQTLILERIE